ncbi:P-loop NTPase fold protein [Geobacter sp. SVR]|uniref:KAP family P-loop NTPase fold protein n=1 Tax=Geobacter sp. SVR TaxID=2495594 RepID=UPI00143F054E|nr:P-loop NTPase fold protein [Geobacter sp. SVR]BCS51816.1 hypothetical protein GSVR_01240 [Geobacter sp. SVR]GCF86997.1 hypothetical protein GSbR_35970 [Geobacter sp. SVR]
MWTDNETDQDLLGFSIHAELLRSIITDPKMLPVTVGLFGDWGGGKSSILKILQRELEQDENVAVIYFNSWVFEGYEDAKSAILTTLLNELRDHRNLKNIIGDETKALLKRVKVMDLLKLGASAGMAYFTGNPLPLLMSSVALSADKTEKNDEGATDSEESTPNKLSDLLKASQDSIENVRSFRSDFQKLINKTKLKSVVILIDDLDRCSPERLIQNLEAIKLFLNVEHTAFIVATDRRIVENAIRLRYSELFTGEKGATTGDSLVTDYLEKLIQVPYTLPKLAPHEVRSYLCMLFLKKYLQEEVFQEVLKKYVTFLTTERYAAFQLGNELASIEDEATRIVVSESMRLVEACSEAITDGLKGNPRQIKRFLNAFWLRRELARVAHIPHLKDHILIKMMVVEYISNERFDDLYQWHRTSDDGTAQPLLELENAESSEDIPEKYANWGTPRLWRWIKAEPRLASEDLRDYFWVARSALSDTLSGVRLMTQAMKACAGELLSKVEPERRSGVSLFNSLTEDEQVGVLGVVMRHAMQDVMDDTALRSLLDLAANNHLNGAEAFSRCIDRIGAAKLSPGFGITLRAFKAETGNRASELVGQVRDKLAKSETNVGRALLNKRKQ